MDIGTIAIIDRRAMIVTEIVLVVGTPQTGIAEVMRLERASVAAHRA